MSATSQIRSLGRQILCASGNHGPGVSVTFRRPSGEVVSSVRPALTSAARLHPSSSPLALSPIKCFCPSCGTPVHRDGTPLRMRAPRRTPDPGPAAFRPLP